MTNLEAIAFFMDMDECTYGGSEPIQMAIKALGQDAIIIPKGATNGDMIKAMFPNAIIEINELGSMVHVKYNNHICWVNYELDWWDAPYKGVQNLSEKSTGSESEDV